MAISLVTAPSDQQAELRKIAQHQRQVTRARRIVTPAMAMNAAALGAAYPHLDGGQVVGLAMTGAQPGDQTAEQVSERQMLQTQISQPSAPSGEGWFDNFVYDPFKGLIRGAFTVLNAGIEEAESLFLRTPIGSYQGVDNALAQSGRSDAFHALSAMFSGESVNLGEGFLPNSTVTEDVQQMLAQGHTLADAMAKSEEQRRLGTPITVEGQMDRERLKLTHRSGKQVPISLGRAAAINFTEPGTRSFQYLSGFTDAMKQVVLDPADLALGGAGKVRKLSKVVGTADEANILSKAARSVMLGDSRKTFFQTGWDDYLNSAQGSYFTQRIANATGEEGYREIYDLYKGTQRGMVDPAHIKQLTDETDVQKVGELIRKLASDQPGEFRKFGRVGFGAMESGGAMPNVFGRGFDPATGQITGQGIGQGIRSTPAMLTAAGFGLGELSVQAGSNLMGAVFGMNPRRLGKAIHIPMSKLVKDAYETGLGFGVRQASTNTYLGRMAASTAARSLNVMDQLQATQALDQYMRSLSLDNATYNKLLYEAADIDGAWKKALEAGSTGYDMHAHWFGILKRADQAWIDKMKLANAPISDEVYEAMVRKYDSVDAMRAYWKDNAGNDMLFGGSRVYYTVDGEAKAMPSAVLFSQFMEESIPLMDQRKIRAAMRRSWWGDKVKTEKLKKLFGQDDYEKLGKNVIVDSADLAMTKLWKPSVLLRVAWPVRVIGEEQFRLSGKLLTGAFNHPMQFITLMLTKDRKFLSGVARMTDDALGRAFTDAAEHEAAMSKSIAFTSGGNFDHRWEAAEKTLLKQEQSAQAYVHSVNQMRNDELTVLIAQRLWDEYQETGTVTGSSLRKIKDEFWSGELEGMRRSLVMDSSRWNIMGIQADADSYIDTVYAHLVHQSGGRGRMLNRYDNTWRDFDGNVTEDVADIPRATKYTELTDRAVTAEMQEYSQRVIQAVDSGEPADAIINGALADAERMAREAGDMTEDTLDSLERLAISLDYYINDLDNIGDPLFINEGILDAFDDFAVETGIVTQSSRRVERPMTQQGRYERIPSQEVLEGETQLTQGDYRRTQQSIQQQSLGDQTNMTRHQGNKVSDMLGKQSEELKNIGKGEYRTFTAESPNGDMTTVTYGHKGTAVAFVTWNIGPNGRPYIQLMGGVDNRGVANLLKELPNHSPIEGVDLLDMYVGEQRFLDWMRLSTEQVGVELPENITTYDALHDWIRQNPDAMKAIEHEMAQGGMLPTSAANAAMTASGQGMYRAMGQRSTRLFPTEDAARGPGPMADLAINSPQHTEYFVLDEMGDVRMLELIATGKVEADDFTWGAQAASKDAKKQFMQRAAYFDDETWFNAMPNYLRRPVGANTPEDVGIWDRAVGTMMDVLMSKPTNQLSRSPAFRQFYWQRMSQIYTAADDELRAAMKEAAVATNITQEGVFALGKPLRALRRASGREVAMDEVIRRFDADRIAGADIMFEAGDNLEATMKELDEIAKAYALHETKGLLYDMSNDHNWSDMARVVAPFGEAWFEVLSTWGKLIAENPRNLRRMQQAYQGAQDSNPFTGTNEDGEQTRGMFFRDPNTNEEVFAFPGSGLLTSWMMGDAAEGMTLTGRVQGLSLATQVLPGLGPVVQIPMSQMGWADDPEMRWARDIVLPFGKSPVNIKNPSTWIDPFLPTWLNRGMAGFMPGDSGLLDPEMKRLYANTTMDVYKTLLLKGWSDQTPEDMQRTLTEAQRIAKDTYKIKWLSSFIGPVTGSELWEVRYDSKDRDGELWAYQNLATAYREILQDMDGDDVQAYKKFTDLFGVDPLLFTTAKTQRTAPRAVTMEARKWEHDNSHLYEQHMFPNTAYYAAPDAPDGEFDYETYMLQLRNGTREPLTAEQWAQRRNQMLGKLAYSNFQRTAERRFASNPDLGDQWLRQQRFNLMHYFPGYGREIPGLPASSDIGTQIEELYRWEQNDVLSTTSVGQTLQKYLDARTRVSIQWMRNYGTSDTGWRTGVNGVMYRASLRKLGETLSQENPDFQPLFTQILLRELQEPEAGQAPVELAGVGF